MFTKGRVGAKQKFEMSAPDSDTVAQWRADKSFQEFLQPDIAIPFNLDTIFIGKVDPNEVVPVFRVITLLAC